MWWTVAKEAVANWSSHKDARQGAALAYYSVFSLGPIILIAVAVAGLFFGQDAVTAQVMSSLKGMLGDTGATGNRGDAGKRKPSRHGRACNRPWDRRSAVRRHRRRRAVKGRAQCRMGSGGVQGKRPLAFRPQLRAFVCRRAGSWFSSSRLAPRNGRLGCRRKVHRSLPARRHICISSACWCRSPL